MRDSIVARYVLYIFQDKEMSSSLAMAPLSDVLLLTKPTKEELTSPNDSQFQIPEDGRNYEIYLPVYSYVVGTYLIVIGKPFWASL